MTYKQFDVVVVPFHFVDSAKQKWRPALVLSENGAFNDQVSHSVMAMISSEKNAPWPLDVPLTNLEQAGLTAASVVRMKLFTLDHRLVMGVAGRLSTEDQKNSAAVLACFAKWIRYSAFWLTFAPMCRIL